MSGAGEELARLLDASGPPADAGTLDRIVGRHRQTSARRMKQVTVASLAVAVAAGGVALSGLVRTHVGSTTAFGAPVSGLRTPTAGPVGRNASPARLGAAPRGLAWAAVGSSGARSGAAVPAKARGSATTTSLPPGAEGAAVVAPDLCTVEGCGTSAGLGPLQGLFRRSAAGVEIRAFSEAVPPLAFEPLIPVYGARGASSGSTGPAPPVTVCADRAALVVEVSDAGAIGQLVVPLVSGASSGAALDLVDSSIVGTREGAPMIVVVARVASSVASVSASFADGTAGSMTAVQGWVVLADAVPDPSQLSSSGEQVTLDALSSTGGVLETVALPAEPSYAVPSACVHPAIREMLPQAAPGAGGTSSVPAKASSARARASAAATSSRAAGGGSR